MAHAAIAFAKAHSRRRVMACTTSIGPGATNMVTAAAVAHVNRLPVLLLPGDVFADRRPDPVLQQVEDFGDPTVSANDCFRPVSRYWDRLTRPEQLLGSLPAAVDTLMDPATCGPVTLALPQDVQTHAFDYPESSSSRASTGCGGRRRPRAARRGRRAAAPGAEPLIVAGGGVHYSLAWDALRDSPSVTRSGRRDPGREGRAAVGPPGQRGALGVTGASAANQLAAEADVVLAIGTRLGDFTTGSRALFQAPGLALVGLNVAASTPASTAPCRSSPTPARARRAVGGARRLAGAGRLAARARRLATEWQRTVDAATAADRDGAADEAQVIGAVNRAAGPRDVVVCAAGGLPGELHKLWRPRDPRGYHLEYGYSCMGYEIAGGLGVKLAHPDREVFVLVGDGSYLMLNSEIAPR